MSRLSVFAAAAVLSTLATTSEVSAKEHHHERRTPQYAGGDHPNQGYVIPGFVYAGPRPPVQDDGPSYNDPSKFGGDEALPVTH